MIWVLLLVLSSITILSIATTLDVTWTDRGLREGAFIESNIIMDWLYKTNKPSPKQLWIYNIGLTAVMSALSIVGLFINNVTLAIGGLGLILGNAAHHYWKGYKACKKLGAK